MAVKGSLAEHLLCNRVGFTATLSCPIYWLQKTLPLAKQQDLPAVSHEYPADQSAFGALMRLNRCFYVAGTSSP
jgi:hypothetical protein